MSFQDIKIANTILSQLGGKQFIMFTGAKNLCAIENGVQMTIPFKTKNKSNVVRIVLNSTDIYNMSFHSWYKDSRRDIEEVKDVYCDQLIDIFEEKTGIYGRLK